MDYSGWITDITPNPSGGNGGFGTGSGPPDPAWTSTLPNVALWTCLLRTIRRLCHHNPSICPCILINVYMTCALVYCLEHRYKASGDLQVVEENYVHIARWLQFYHQYTNASLTQHPGAENAAL